MKTRSTIALALLVACAPAIPANAADSAATAAASFSTQTTTIGDLLDNPQAHAILDKHLPGFAGNPQIDMARAMTLRQIQSFAADKLTDEVLAKIDADLANLTKPAA